MTATLSYDNFTEMLDRLMDSIAGAEGEYRDLANASFALLVTVLAKCEPMDRGVFLELIEDGALRRRVSRTLESGAFPLTEADTGKLH